jgi:hypothetical protein
MTDLDALATPEWQTVPSVDNEEKEAELTARAQEAATGSVAYAVAQQALWHNCPDALETALDYVRQETELMDHKLQFTRIRQQFVSACQDFHRSDKPSSLEGFRERAASVDKQCVALMERQPFEQSLNLPGLITRRDTILLQQRIRDISKRIISSARRISTGKPCAKRREQGFGNQGAKASSILNQRWQALPPAQGSRPQMTLMEEALQRTKSQGSLGSRRSRTTSPGARGHCREQREVHLQAGQSQHALPRRSAAAPHASSMPHTSCEVVSQALDAGITASEYVEVDVTQYLAWRRSELINALFQYLDTDGNNRLRWPELRMFLSQLWQSEQVLGRQVYLELCRELSVSPLDGLDRDAFEDIVDDGIEGGHHCTNSELAGFLAIMVSGSDLQCDGILAMRGGA